MKPCFLSRPGDLYKEILQKQLLNDIDMGSEKMGAEIRCNLKFGLTEFCGAALSVGFISIGAGTHRKRRAGGKVRLGLVIWALMVLFNGIGLVDVAAEHPATGLEGQLLVDALRKGGYNIYFRHAATDWSQNDQVHGEGDWTSCDPNKMRQLSDDGRQTAAAVGEAMRTLQIPIGQVFASPYCRTVETAKYMNLGPVATTTDIMNLRVAAYFGGTSAVIEHTRRRLSMLPQAGSNNVFVAHGNVLVNATHLYPQEAEAIVFRPAGSGIWTFAARILPREWARLVTEYSKR